MKRLIPLATFALAGLLVCCQQQNQTPTEKPVEQTPAPQYLGTVHQVYPTQKFALLRIIGPIPAPGETLVTHPADGSTARMGNLVVAQDEPRSGMIVADIRSGEVAGGDRVFLYRNISLPDLDQVKKVADAVDSMDSSKPSPSSVPEMPQVALPTPPSLPVAPAAAQPPVAQPTPAPAAAEPAPAKPAVHYALPIAPAAARAAAARAARQAKPTTAPSRLDSIPDDISQLD